MNQLKYRQGDAFVPKQSYENDVQTVIAEPFLQVHNERGVHTEGLCFDRNGNLYYTVIYSGKVCRINMETKEITEVWSDSDSKPASVKIHRDGRLFISCLNKNNNGRLFSINPDGSGYRDIISADRGYNIDDIAFLSDGSFFFSDMRGDLTHRIGGVYHVSPDYGTITPFMPDMASPNGVAVSTDESVLWVTECHSGLIHRALLSGYRTKNVVNYVPGYFGPDSCEIDADDNLYVAMCGQGRVLVFNYYGFLIGQILLPGREKGLNLWSTHTYIRPGTDEIYIISCDDNGDEGSWIFRAGAFARSHDGNFQFQK